MWVQECVFTFVVIIAIACAAQLPSYRFLHGAFLDQNGAVKMLWTPEEDDITIEVQAATPGWVGLGFSPSGGMGGADIVIGWVDDNGQVNLQDRFAMGNQKPKIDRSQDYELLGGYQNETHTVIRFSRPWKSCDEENDVNLGVDTTRVIWAYNDNDPVDEDSVTYHSHRGTKSLYLMEPQLGQMTLKEEAQYWDVFSPNVTLPSNVDTIYWCKLYKIPDLKQKHHIIGYKPIVREGNFKYVHHIVMYECNMANSEQVYEKFVNAKGAQCHSANMPLSWRACQSPLVTWAVGSDGGFLPEHVGFPIGEEHGGANYFMLELHYDNPSFDEGVVDDSGLRIYHTDVLREHDAGSIVVGHDVFPMVIPPNRIWNTVGYCSSECTEESIPSRGINVFSALLHTHVLGTKIKFRQIRDGKELPVILKDENYDFNYQEARWLKPELKILPGDFFLNECVYDSKRMRNTTFGGFGTREEMCLTFLSYYPKINLAGCTSNPAGDIIQKHLGIEEFYETPEHGLGMSNATAHDLSKIEDQLLAKMTYNDSFMGEEVLLAKFLEYKIIKKPSHLQNKTLYDVLTNRSTWSNEKKVNEFQKLIVKSHKVNCAPKGSQGTFSMVNYPEFMPYKEPKASCGDTSKGDNEDLSGIDEDLNEIGDSPPRASTSTETVSSPRETRVTTTTKTDFATIITVSTVYSNGTTATNTRTSSKEMKTSGDMKKKTGEMKKKRKHSSQLIKKIRGIAL